MDFEYRIDPEAGLIFTRFEGKFDVATMIACLKRIYADPQFTTGMDSLNDLRLATIDWDYDDVERFRTFIQSVEHIRGKCRWALLVKGGATYVSARIASVIGEAHGIGIEVKLFDNDSEGLEWLRKTT